MGNSKYFEVDQACSNYLHAPSESDTADTEINFVAPVAGKADLEDEVRILSGAQTG